MRSSNAFRSRLFTLFHWQSLVSRTLASLLHSRPVRPQLLMNHADSPDAGLGSSLILCVSQCADDTNPALGDIFLAINTP